MIERDFDLAPDFDGYGTDDDMPPRLTPILDDEMRMLDTDNFNGIEDVYIPIHSVTDDSRRNGIYLRNIGSIKLLTPDLEITYSKANEQGRFAKEMLDGKQYQTEDDQLQLEQLVREGNEAQYKLTVANLRWVVAVSRKYMGRGLPLDDLIQEGNIGLTKAVDRYDWRRGFRFSTYAYWWIRQAVTRAIADQVRTIRVPVHMIDRIGRMHRKFIELQQITGSEPTVDEIAEVMNLNRKQVREMIRAESQPISLDSPVGDDGDSTIGDFVEDTSVCYDPYKLAAQGELRNSVNKAFNVLTDREKDVMKMRFGLDDGREKTLVEVGERFGVSRERIRQIEKEALQKLRDPKVSENLREYLE